MIFWRLDRLPSSMVRSDMVGPARVKDDPQLSALGVVLYACKLPH